MTRRPPQVTGNDADRDEETLGSFYMGRMRSQAAETERVLPRGLLATIVLIGFVGLIWYAYPEGDQQYEDSDIPVIVADTAPYKFTPDDPGGMEVRHQDSTVFNSLVGKSNNEVERLLPRPEEPLDKANVLGQPEKSAPADQAVSERTLEAREQGLNLAPSDETEAAADDNAPEVLLSREDVADDDTDGAQTLTALATAGRPQAQTEASPKEPLPSAKPAAIAAATTTAPAPAPTTATPSATGAAPGFYVQLGSFRVATGAQTEWRTLQSRYPQSLGAVSSRVERADLGDKGVWYRLFAGPMPEAKARDICQRMKAENAGGCIVRKL